MDEALTQATVWARKAQEAWENEQMPPEIARTAATISLAWSQILLAQRAKRRWRLRLEQQP